jgi:serine protease inhibitor
MVEPANLKELRPITFEEQLLIEQSNQLTFEFLTQLSEKEPNSNVFISPFSIGMAMGMIYNGVDEQGKKQLNSMMGFSGSEIMVNKTFNQLTELLKRIDKDVKISIANSFYHDRKFVLNELFKDKIMAYYDADAEALNFESTHASNYINRIFSIKMNRDIEKINFPISSDYNTLQINAVGFSGKWTYNPEVIIEGRFDKIDAQFEFTRNAIVQIYEDETKKIIDIPYGNGQYSMTIFMPQTALKNQTFEYRELQDFLINADTARVDLFLPVITTNYQFNLKNIINKHQVYLNPEMNHNAMFIGNAPSQLDAMIQEAYLEPFSLSILPLITDQDFLRSSRSQIVDKPFVYFIREKHTGIILFAGKFKNPGS